MDQSVRSLKHLTNVDGIVGYEMQVEEIMRNYIESISDQTIEDNLSDIFGKKDIENDQYSTMIPSHMDEVGLMVTKIDKHGSISFMPVDGWWN